MAIYGWDMSHFDAPGIGDAVAEGFVFLTHKAGGDKDDAEISAWWNGVKGLDDNVLLGAYWVLYPGNPPGRADAFLARLDATCPGWRNRPWILQVDCEKWGGDPDTVPSRAEIKAFCDRLVSKMPKLRPIVYAPEWVYGDRLAGLGYPLWASAYVSGSGVASKLYPGDGSSKWGAYSGQVPAILQFTSSATIAGQTTCDANAFRGTLAELTALVAPGWEIDTMSKQDALDALGEFFARSTQDGKTGGPITSRIGRDALDQGIPDGLTGEKTNAWAVLQHLGSAVGKLSTVVASMAAGSVTQADIDALRTAVDQVDENVAARLIGATPEATAAALKAVLGDQAAEVGRILAAA